MRSASLWAGRTFFVSVYGKPHQIWIPAGVGANPPPGVHFGKLKTLSLYRIRLGVNGDVPGRDGDNGEIEYGYPCLPHTLSGRQGYFCCFT